MLEPVCLIGLLRGGVVGGQFLGRRGGREWRLEKIEVKRATEQSQGGRSRIRRVKVFHGRGLFGGVRRRQ